MKRLRRFVKRLTSWAKTAGDEERLRAEIEAHIALQTEDNIRAGLSPVEARRQAVLKFGAVEAIKEEYRDQRGLPFIEALLYDTQYALRQLRRSPGFTAVAVLTLALGIGANTAIFSLVNAVMLRNLPVRDPGRLVLFSDNPQESMSINEPDSPSDFSEIEGKQTLFSYPFYKKALGDSRSFEVICAFQTPDDTLTVRAGHEAEVQVAQGKLVSGNFFSVLGVQAALGRTLAPADDRPGAAPVAVVSYNYWRGKMGGDPAVVGRVIDIDGIPVTVAGVGPPGFFGVRMKADSPDFWMPLCLRPILPLSVMPQAKSLLSNPNIYWLNMMGRLKPGVGIAQARAEINGELRRYATARLGSKITESNRSRIQNSYVPLVPGGRGLSEIRYQYSGALGILLAIVGLVLLIACANVANLMLARATARKKEMAVRLALGGGRGRLVRQVLTECLLLAIAGASVGAVLASWGVAVLVALVAAKVPLTVRPDPAVLGFTIGVSALAVVLSGLAPALRSVRVDLIPALKSTSSPDAKKGTPPGLDKVLVAFQIATSLLLLVGASLLVRSLVSLENQNLGFSPDHVLLVNIDPGLAGYQPKQLPGLFRELRERVGALPGVRSASVGMTSPMSGSSAGFDVSVEGQAQPSGGGHPQVVVVGPGYFETEGMRMMAGRSISPQDDGRSPTVAVVNQAFARKYIPHGHPVGKRVGMGAPFKPPGFEIVGIVTDAKFSGARDPAGPMIFLSAFQIQSVMTSVNEVEVRTAGDPASVTGEVRQTLRRIDPNLPITSLTTLTAQVNDSLGQQRAVSALAGFFGALGLLLACVGLYGIMAYNVAQGTHEIGIRMALGARKGEILTMVIGQGLKLVLIGVAIGLAGALALTRFLSSMLYGVTPTDPVTFIAVSLILTCVALVASYIPGRRAAKVDPMVALRYE